VQQLLEDCERLKQEGNAAYTRGDYDEALQLYWQVSACRQAPQHALLDVIWCRNSSLLLAIRSGVGQLGLC
jgi:hypothetical protein